MASASANLVLAITTAGAAYGWYRAGFRIPQRVRVRASARLAFAVAGCVVVVLTSGYSLGEIIEGSAQVSKHPVHYARRAEEPRVFWRQVALQTGIGFLLGVAVIGLGRRLPRSSSSSARTPETSRT
jgi:hypothetical protein